MNFENVEKKASNQGHKIYC